MNNPFIISSCKTYTTYSDFFIVSQNIIAFPHRRWLAAYVPTHHIRRHALTSSNCDRYMRSAKCTSTDRVIKCDDRPIPISGRSIGASLETNSDKTTHQPVISARPRRKLSRKAHAEESAVTVQITLRIHLLKHKAWLNLYLIGSNLVVMERSPLRLTCSPLSSGEWEVEYE